MHNGISDQLTGDENQVIPHRSKFLELAERRPDNRGSPSPTLNLERKTSREATDKADLVRMATPPRRSAGAPLGESARDCFSTANHHFPRSSDTERWLATLEPQRASTRVSNDLKEQSCLAPARKPVLPAGTKLNTRVKSLPAWRLREGLVEVVTKLLVGVAVRRTPAREPFGPCRGSTEVNASWI